MNILCLGRWALLTVTLSWAVPALNAYAETCDLLKVTVTGHVAGNTEKERSIDPRNTEGDVLSIPLDSIGAGDADIRVRLRRTEEAIWAIDTINAPGSEKPENIRFDLAVSRIDFTQSGDQEAQQYVELLPFSSSERGSQARVIVAFEGISLHSDSTALAITTIDNTAGPCQMAGVPQGIGQARLVYYSPEDALEAMLADTPDNADQGLK